MQKCQASIEELMQEQFFDKILNSVTELAGGEKIDKAACRSFYHAVITHVVNEMSKRFNDFADYEYVCLLNHEKFESFNASFPTKIVKMLVSQHSFDEAKLCNELTVLYSREEIWGLKVPEIICLVIGQNLKQTFSETLKLAKLILTIPSTAASVERSFSVLRRIKNYLRSTMGQKRLFSLMLMAVENELLKEIAENPKFYDEVIDAFAKLNERRINLL